MKFEVKDYESCGITIDDEYYLSSLIELGSIILKKKPNKRNSACINRDRFIDYHGITNALCGKNFLETFNPKRIFVIQMESNY